MCNVSFDVDSENTKKIIDLIGDCTDTYIYVYNLTKNSFSITRELSQFFIFSKNSFDNASEIIRRVVCEEDISRYNKESEKILSGQTNEHLLNFRIIDRNDNLLWITSKGRVVFEEKTGDKFLIGRVSFIDQKKLGDNLTGLISDTQFLLDLKNIKNRQTKLNGFIMKLDVDNLGLINEQYGLDTGDKVIKILADCCRRVADEETKLYRSQSDEIIFFNFSGMNALDAQHMYLALKREISTEEEKSGYDTMFTVSAGTVAFFEDSTPIDELVNKLDFSLKEAKHNGKNRNQLYNASSYNSHLRQIYLQEQLRNSVKADFEGFELLYQPVVNAKSKELIGAEALLRWKSEDTGTVMPDEFIPILEDTGLIIPVGRWILLTAFEQCKKWSKFNPEFHMSINLSYVQIKRSDILADIQTSLLRTGVKPHNIALEITESGFIGGETTLSDLTMVLSKMGFRIDIDDFGTGYSNLRYLQYLHADTLKLDYTFTNKAVHNEYDRNVIKHITAMAHSINMQVCMEGVEFVDEEEILSKLNPDRYQGYLFGRPISSAEFYERHLQKYLVLKMKKNDTDVK